MISKEKHFGGSTNVSFGTSHQLKRGTGRVVVATATAANLNLKLPDATKRNPGVPQFYVINAGSNTFDIVTFGSASRYAASVHLQFGLGGLYESQGITVVGTENGSSWTASVAMPDALGTLTATLAVDGSKPAFTLAVATPSGAASFTLHWDGYDAISSVVQTGTTGDGDTYTIASVGAGAVQIGSLAAGKLAILGLTQSVNAKASGCGGNGGWVMGTKNVNAARTAGFDRSGSPDPCITPPDPTSPPPPPPPCVTSYQLRYCGGDMDLVPLYVDIRLFTPGQIVKVDDNCYTVSDVIVFQPPGAATLIEDCDVCGTWQLQKWCVAFHTLVPKYVLKADYTPLQIVGPIDGVCYRVTNISSTHAATDAPPILGDCDECDAEDVCDFPSQPSTVVATITFDSDSGCEQHDTGGDIPCTKDTGPGAHSFLADEPVGGDNFDITCLLEDTDYPIHPSGTVTIPQGTWVARLNTGDFIFADGTDNLWTKDGPSVLGAYIPVTGTIPPGCPTGGTVVVS